MVHLEIPHILALNGVWSSKHARSVIVPKISASLHLPHNQTHAADTGLLERLFEHKLSSDEMTSMSVQSSFDHDIVIDY